MEKNVKQSIIFTSLLFALGVIIHSLVNLLIKNHVSALMITITGMICTLAIISVVRDSQETRRQEQRDELLRRMREHLFEEALRQMYRDMRQKQYEEELRRRERNRQQSHSSNTKKEQVTPNGKIKISAYDVLEIPRGSSQEEIKAAYRRMAIKYHPDKNPSKDAEKKMKLINDAKAILIKG